MEKISSYKIQKLMPVILLLVFMLVIPVLLNGQPELIEPPPQGVPIDGGLSILAALGGGYAIKKLRDKNKE